MTNNVRQFEVKKTKFEVYSENPQFLKVKFYAIAEGLNRNDSSFSLDSMVNAIPTTNLKPILAYWEGLKFNEEGTLGDFSHHISTINVDNNGKPYYNYVNGERPIGVIVDDPKPSIETYQGKEFLVFYGLIWTEYNKQAVDLLKKRRSNKTSVEIEVEESEIDDKTKVEMIHKFTLLGITLLGNDVSEGIEGSHLETGDLLDVEKSENFVKFKRDFFSALHGEKDIVNVFVSKEEVGSKQALKIDKSAKSMSETAWGSVDKASLKKSCLMASNYKSIIPDVFLKLDDGWQDGKEGALHYHVMQIKNGVLVYNRYGLSSALAYAEKYGESSVVSKIKSIYKALGLDKPEKKEKKLSMKKYSNMPEKYHLLGLSGKYMILFCNDGMYAVPEPETDDMEFSEEAVKPFELTAEFEEEKFGLTSVFAEYAIESEKNMAEMCKMSEEKTEMAKQIEDYTVKAGLYEEEKAKFAEKEAKFAEMEKSYEEQKAEFEKAKAEMEVVKMSQFEKDARKAMEDDSDADDETKKEFEVRMANKEFKSVEEFEKEFAYAKYKKAKMAKKPEAEKLNYSLIPNPNPENTGEKDKFTIAKELVDAKTK